MSRLSTLSPAALRAMFSPDADDDIITLMTLSGPGMTTQRVADGYTQRISETADEVVYGVVSRGMTFVFLPMEITLPSDEATAPPRASVTVYDVAYALVPALRTISRPPDVTLEVVLASTPDVVEASFPGLTLGNINYDVNVVTGELTTESFAGEPFPCHTCNPSYFPGLF